MICVLLHTHPPSQTGSTHQNRYILAERIQLQIEYAPEPRFHSGTREQASAPVLDAFYEKYGNAGSHRENAAREYAVRNGINTGELH